MAVKEITKGKFMTFYTYSYAWFKECRKFCNVYFMLFKCACSYNRHIFQQMYKVVHVL